MIKPFTERIQNASTEHANDSHVRRMNLVMYDEAYRETWEAGRACGFHAGARWALNYHEVAAMREALADIIRNSSDIVAKKVASRAIEAFDAIKENQ